MIDKMTKSHIILLPVYKGVVQATIDKGHRWSDIEHLVLIGLCQNDYTITELECQSNLPSEVLLEAINRLMRAGWVEIKETENRIAFRATLFGLAEAVKVTLTNDKSAKSVIAVFVAKDVPVFTSAFPPDV